MIVDCHTHWDSDSWPQDHHDPWSWWKMPEKHGVTHAVVIPLAGLTDDSKLQLENDRIHELCASSGGRMIPFCTVNPAQGEKAVQELQRCIEKLGCRGLKIHPWLQGVGVNTHNMDQLCEVAAVAGIPVIFHDGTPCFSLPSQIALLARRHPKTTIILGHLGMMEHWREAIAVMQNESNVWDCLCGPHVMAMQEALHRCDRNRLLWGSDYGFGTADPIGYRLDLLKIQGLHNRDLEVILESNPQRLLHITETVPPAQPSASQITSLT